MARHVRALCALFEGAFPSEHHRQSRRARPLPCAGGGTILNIDLVSEKGPAHHATKEHSNARGPFAVNFGFAGETR